MVRNPEATWEFPKGSIEYGESEMDAALRELREEAALTRVKILPDFRDHVTYSYRRDDHEIDKIVTFFLAEVFQRKMPALPPTREHTLHPEEGLWCVWGDESKTRSRLFHPGMRELLRRAFYFIYAYDRLQKRAGHLSRPPKRF